MKIEAMYQEVIKAQQNSEYPYFPVIESASDRLVELENNQKVLMLASCDYLGLSNDPRLKKSAQKAIEKYGTNICGSIMFSGYTALHRDFENSVAEFMKAEDAMLFPTSYLANLGCISSMVGVGDVVILDKLNHVSLFQGAQLSGAAVALYSHNDMNRLEKVLKACSKYKNKLIAVDGLFSADGDFSNLPDIIDLSQKYNTRLLVDEAHSFGVVGANGRGVAEYFGVADSVDLIIATMSKGMGSTGGVVVGNKKLLTYLKHVTAPFHSSRAVSPGVIGASLKAIEVVREEGIFLRSELDKKSAYFRQKLQELGINILQTKSAIIPIIFDSTSETIRVTLALKEKGILGSAMLPPSVPKDTPRIRLGVTTKLTINDLDHVAHLLNEIMNN